MGTWTKIQSSNTARAASFYQRLRLVTSALRKYKLAFGAFLIPLAIRAIPELLVGPYPVGWDVITYYVPNVLDIASGSVNVWGILASTPVMYGLVVPIYVLTRISPIWIFKALGPILYGLLGLSIFTFCQRRLRWTGLKSFYAVLFVVAYFVVMRISWDAYRMEFGLAFLLLGESILVTGTNSRKAELGRIALLSLAALSNQLVGVIVAGVLLVQFLRLSRDRRFGTAFLQAIPVGFFLLIVYAMTKTPISTGLAVLGATSDISTIPSTALFLLYAYAAVLPLLYFGLRLQQKTFLVTWTATCFLGIGLSILPGHVFQDIAYRWVLLLSIPILVFAFEGYSRLKESLRFSPVLWTRGLQMIVVVGLMISATLFAILPAQSAFTYYTSFNQYLPSSMVQSSIPASDYQNTANAMLWVNARMSSNSVLITQQAFYGWARAYVSPARTIVSSDFDSPNTEIGEVRAYAHVFTIWWAPGTGWFQSSAPSGARQIASFGDLTVYQYR